MKLPVERYARGPPRWRAGRYFTHIWGIIRHWLPASGEKMRKAPILFHYTNLAEGVTEQRLENRMFMCRWRDGESLPECEPNHSR